MQVSEYIDHVAAEGKLFADAAEATSLDTPIEGCAPWDMRALVRHLGLIHLWAAAHVRFSTDDWLDGSDDIPSLGQYWPELGSAWPGDDGLVGWYRRTNENLVEVLRSVPADHQCMTFLPAPDDRTMWSRRQASEIAIHRFDAEYAGGATSHFDAEFAADMLDELLSAFAPRDRATPVPVSDTTVLCVDAEDVGEQWYVTMTPDRMDTTRDGERADLTVSGTAEQLYILMWNRTPDVPARLTGDSAVLDAWREACRVRWSGGE